MTSEVANLLDHWKGRALAAEQRVRQLETQLAVAEGLLGEWENLSRRSVDSLDNLIAALLADQSADYEPRALPFRHVRLIDEGGPQ